MFPRDEQNAELMSRWNGRKPGIIVLFGGSPYRRDEVVRFLGERLDVTVIGTLSEEEGLATLERLGTQVSVVLIGGRYAPEQRARIREHVARTLPGVTVSEPGFAFPYENEAIVADLSKRLSPA
jgi:hypothetical protein